VITVERSASHGRRGVAQLDFVVDGATAQGQAHVRVQVRQVERSDHAGADRSDASGVQLPVSAEQQVAHDHGADQVRFVGGVGQLGRVQVAVLGDVPDPGRGDQALLGCGEVGFQVLRDDPILAASAASYPEIGSLVRR
jgi:hypothetical protein